MKSAFTLIELLVVVAIIGVLAGILFPVFARVRAKGYATSCLSNVGQLSKGILMYAADNSEIVPRESLQEHYWLDQLTGYAPTDKTLACPSFSDPKQLRRGNLIGLALNNCVDNLTAIGDSSRTALLTETTTGRGIGGPATELINPNMLDVPDIFRYGEDMQAQGVTYDMQLPFGAERHLGSSNYALSDGHAVSLKPGQIRVPYNRSCLHAVPSWFGQVNGILFRTKDLEGS